MLFVRFLLTSQITLVCKRHLNFFPRIFFSTNDSTQFKSITGSWPIVVGLHFLSKLYVQCTIGPDICHIPEINSGYFSGSFISFFGELYGIVGYTIAK